MMKYGYARVSTIDQNIETQIEQLKANGCEIIFQEKITGRSKDVRTELNKLLNTVKAGDTVVITKIDRIARNMRDGLEIINTLREKGVAIHVLNMGLIDNTPVGELILNVLLAVAQFEVDMIRERQREGIEQAKKRGVYKGRPKQYTDKNPALKHAIELFMNRDKNGMTVKEICEITKIGRSTLYREIKARGL
jgi:DNA invertase Pin-like site-specific DNA recombinase